MLLYYYIINLLNVYTEVYYRNLITTHSRNSSYIDRLISQNNDDVDRFGITIIS